MTDEFRLTEKILYDYPKNSARLKVLTEDLRVLRISTDVKAQSYDKPPCDPLGHSDPVMSYVIKLETLEEKIKELERITEPIKSLVDYLNAPYILENSDKNMLKKILDFYYFGGNTQTDVLKELHVSRTQLYKNRLDLVELAGVYLGIDVFILLQKMNKLKTNCKQNTLKP